MMPLTKPPYFCLLSFLHFRAHKHEASGSHFLNRELHIALRFVLFFFFFFFFFLMILVLDLILYDLI